MNPIDMDFETPARRTRAHARNRPARRALVAGLTGMLLAGTALVTTGASADAARIPPRCTVGQLHVTVAGSEGAAGTMYYLLRFTNVSHSTCSLRGYPGVSFTNSRGHQLGLPALWRRLPIQRVVLARGASAHTTFAVHNAGAYSVKACRPARTIFIRVYPPGSYRSALVPLRELTCTTSLGRAAVDPLSAGRGTP